MAVDDDVVWNSTRPERQSLLRPVHKHFSYSLEIVAAHFKDNAWDFQHNKIIFVVFNNTTQCCLDVRQPRSNTHCVEQFSLVAFADADLIDSPILYPETNACRAVPHGTVA